MAVVNRCERATEDCNPFGRRHTFPLAVGFCIRGRLDAAHLFEWIFLLEMASPLAKRQELVGCSDLLGTTMHS